MATMREMTVMVVVAIMTIMLAELMMMVIGMALNNENQGRSSD